MVGHPCNTSTEEVRKEEFEVSLGYTASIPRLNTELVTGFSKEPTYLPACTWWPGRTESRSVGSVCKLCSSRHSHKSRSPHSTPKDKAKPVMSMHGLYPYQNWDTLSGFTLFHKHQVPQLSPQSQRKGSLMHPEDDSRLGLRVPMFQALVCYLAP